MEHNQVLSENWMVLANVSPPHIASLCHALFDTGPSGDPYHGQGKNGWDENTWFVNVDTGGDDPNIYMLSYPIGTKDIPKIVAGQSIGVSGTGGILSLIERFDPPFRNAGVKLLPETLQPFLSKARGLMLYCEKEIDPRQEIPSEIFERLNKQDVDISLAILDGNAVLWTASQSRTRQLFEVGKFIKQVLT